MINLLTALDIEVKYWTWLRSSGAARRLDARCPDDTRRVFLQIYHTLSGAHVYGGSL